MTDKEYINSISAMSTQNLLNNLEDFGYDNYYRDLYRATMRELKKRSCWHKVVDEGFPINNGWYICALTNDTTIWTRPMKFRQGTFVIPEDPRIFDGIAHRQVVAWMELTKYEE